MFVCIVRMYIHTYMHLCIHVWMSLWMYTYIYVHLDFYEDVHVHVMYIICISMCICICICTCIYMHVHYIQLPAPLGLLRLKCCWQDLQRQARHANERARVGQLEHPEGIEDWKLPWLILESGAYRRSSSCIATAVMLSRGSSIVDSKHDKTMKILARVAENPYAFLGSCVHFPRFWSSQFDVGWHD